MPTHGTGGKAYKKAFGLLKGCLRLKGRTISLGVKFHSQGPSGCPSRRVGFTWFVSPTRKALRIALALPLFFLKKKGPTGRVSLPCEEGNGLKRSAKKLFSNKMSPQTETRTQAGFKAGVKDYRLTYYTPD